MKYVKRFFPLLLLLALCACGEKIEPGTAEKTHPVVKNVRIAKASPQGMPVLYEAVGTVRAGVSGRLASKVTGSVEKVNVEEGDRVKKGQVLVVIEGKQLKARLDMALAGLSQARKDLNSAVSGLEEAKASQTLASATYKRYLKLKERGSVSDQEFDEVKASYLRAKASVKRAMAMVAASRARVKQAQAKVSAAKIVVDDTLVTAPYDGVVSKKMVDEGDLVGPGKPLLVVDTTGSYRVDTVVPEAYASYIIEGMSVKVRIPPIGDTDIEGVIYAIAPYTDPSSRSFLVKVKLPSGRAYKSGMFARVLLPLTERPTMLIPKSSIVEVGQLTGLFVVRKGIARFRLVRLGKSLGDKVEVLSGLRENEVYVVAPPGNLIDGAKVEVGA